MVEVIEALRSQLVSGRACATATIVSTTGSIPNEAGAKMLVGPGGKLLAGTIGGGIFEHAALAEAGAAIADGRSRMFAWSLTEKQAGGIGMLCGGTAQVFIEVFAPAPLLVMLGGGHVAIRLWRLARPLGFRGIVVDERLEWANGENFPGCEILALADPEAALERIDWIENSYLVIGTPDHDTRSLRAAARQDVPCRLIGMIASKRKTLTILKSIEDEGVDLGHILPRFHAPVGLDLGPSKSPEAVALSIMAELQARRLEGTGRPLDVANHRHELLAGRGRKSGKSAPVPGQDPGGASTP